MPKVNALALIPGDEIVLDRLADEVFATGVKQGYLTISNALAQFDVQTSGFRATLRHSEHQRCRPASVRDLRANDPQNVLKGEVIGACVHDAMQRKSAWLEQRRHHQVKWIP